MKLRINLKQSLAAAALLSTAVFTVACSTATAGTPSAGASVAGTSSSSPSPTTSSSEPSTGSQSGSAPSTVIDEPTVVVDAPGLDGTSAIWLQNSCTDIGTLQGGSIVDTVSGHSYQFAVSLQSLDNSHLVLRRHTSKYRNPSHSRAKGFFIHLIQFTTGDRFVFFGQ